MAKFNLGQLVATPAALSRFDAAFQVKCLNRHASGDWGDVCPEDWEENELSLKQGSRLFSVYKREEDTLWVITEADRSFTTLLLPSDY